MTADATPAHSRAPLEIEPIDKHIIELLTSDGRMAYADIGTRVGLSGDAVRNRLRRLQDNEVLEVVGSVSASLLGLDSAALIGITVSGPAAPIAEALAGLECADLVVHTVGTFDIVIETVCRTDSHLLGVLDGQIRTIAGVKDCHVMMYLDVPKYSPGGPRVALMNEGPVDGQLRIDDLAAPDRALIAQLQQDGRASYQQLAEASGLTYASTRRRVIRLIEQRIVRIVTVVNQLVLSNRVMAGVGLNVHGPVSSVIDALRPLPEIEMIVATTGRFDVVLEVSCGSKRELATFVGDTLRTLTDIRSSETFGYVDVQKLPYTWASL
ncbi:Lrp/AsnC family transcriptional regulator [Actinomycetes bacterium M1A6_2h]